MSTDATTVAPEEQLAYESRVRTRQTAVAVAAGVLLVVAAAVQLGGAHTKVDELTTDLIVANQRFPLDLIASVINGLASLAIAWTLSYLCALRERAQHGRPRLHPLDRRRRRGALGGHRGGLRDHRGDQGPPVRDHRRADLRGGQPPDQLLGPDRAAADRPGGRAAARRRLRARLAQRDAPGLLTRFMGYLGIFAGALVLFQITQIPIVQGYWLAAVGYLLSGRWPTGMPPAWTTGRGRAVAALGGDAGAKVAGPAPAPAPRRRDARLRCPAAVGPAPDARPHPRAATSKRKRKRRS